MGRIKFRNITNFARKAYRFGWFIPFTNALLVYGRKIMPSGLLRKMAIKRNLKVETYIDNVIGSVQNLISTNSNNESHKSKIIWFCWLQGEDNMPELTKVCLKSIQKNASGCDVRIISLDNLNEYIHLPERIRSLYAKGNITAAHLSDIIRLGLLSTYGGFWIDATMLLAKPIPENIFEYELYSMKSDPVDYYVSDCRWAGFCFYMQKNSLFARLANVILLRYWEKEDWLIDYFMIDYIFDLLYRKVPAIRNAMDKIPMNNPNLHALFPLILEDFNQETYDNITNDTSFFKLNWKMYSTSQLNSNANSFYTHIKNSLIDG